MELLFSAIYWLPFWLLAWAMAGFFFMASMAVGSYLRTLLGLPTPSNGGGE